MRGENGTGLINEPMSVCLGRSCVLFVVFLSFAIFNFKGQKLKFHSAEEEEKEEKEEKGECEGEKFFARAYMRVRGGLRR